MEKREQRETKYMKYLKRENNREKSMIPKADSWSKSIKLINF